MNLSPKIANKFKCELCDYKCCKKSDFNKHLITDKHINRTKLNNLEQISRQNRQNFICKYCNKCYKVRNSLWYHEQKCGSDKKEFINENKEFINDHSDKEIILLLIKENSDLKNMMMKVLENGTHNTTNNNNINNTNSHNKAFNLNFFLNETCKNAMNITDFVESIKLQLSDLMDVGELGYVEGISKIIVKNLNNLDETERPIHCTDKKRETFYIKDEDKWEKDDEERKKIKNTIQKVVNKNIRMLPLFKENFPDYNDSHSKHSDQYSKIVIESMVCDKEKDEKIIKNISKVTSINK
jgi:hypothetical protein